MRTLDFYNRNAEAYSAKTFDADLSSIRGRFTSHLPTGGKILDLGCGSGRDSVAFRSSGFEVTAVDGSVGMCRIAERNTGLTVRRLLFEDLDYEDEFDGVWACSSLLHLPSDNLPKVLELIVMSLKRKGLFFTCFKKGTFEGERPDGRYYTDMEQSTLRQMMVDSGFEPIEIWESEDRTLGQIWVNTICRKKENCRTTGNHSDF